MDFCFFTFEQQIAGFNSNADLIPTRAKKEALNHSRGIPPLVQTDNYLQVRARWNKVPPAATQNCPFEPEVGYLGYD